MSTLLLLGFSIGLDNLVAGMSLGTLQLDSRRRQILAVLFGLFEAMMPLAGLVLGRELAAQFMVPWLGPAMLAATAILILLGARHGTTFALKAWQSAWIMLLPALLSFDNLLAGSAVVTLGFPPLLSVTIIGMISAALAATGLYFGAGLTRRMPFLLRSVAGIGLFVLVII